MSARPPLLSPIVRPGPRLDALLRDLYSPSRQRDRVLQHLRDGELVALIEASSGPERLSRLGVVVGCARHLDLEVMRDVLERQWWPTVAVIAEAPLAPWLSVELLRRSSQLGAAAARVFCDAYLARFEVDEALTWHLDNSYRGQLEPPIAALVARGGDDALGLVTRVVLTAKPATSKHAARALAGAGEAGVSCLLYVLERGETPARTHAAQALARPPNSAVPALEAALQAERSAVVRAALGVALFNGRAPDRVPFDQRPRTAEAHAAIDAAIAKQPAMRLPRWLHLKELLPLRWGSGSHLSDGATRWILTRLAGETIAERDPDLAAVLAHTRRDNHPLILKQLEQQRATRGPIKAPEWLLWARARLGDAAMLEATGRELWNAAYLGLHGAACNARDVLILAEGAAHLHWFDRLLNKGRWRKLCDGAWDALARRADGAVSDGTASDGTMLDADALLEQALPTLGFDADGRKPVPYGQRDFELVMGDQGAIELWGEGRRFLSLPRARKIDDPDVVKAAQKHVREERSRIKDYSESQTARFERAIGAGRVWRAERWRALLEHPLTRLLVRGLIWERVGLSGGRRCFVDDHGELMDQDYEPVALPRSARIRLAHPAEMSAAERARWWEVFGENERVPALDQFSRGVLTAADDPRPGLEERAPLRPYFVDILRARAYRPEGPPGAPVSCARAFADGWSVRFAYTPFERHFTGVEQPDDTALTGFWFLRDGREAPGDEAPGRVLCEGLRDLIDVLD